MLIPMTDIQPLAETPGVATPAVIYREDYRAPDWLIPETHMDFDLGLSETRVAAILMVTRNGDHDRSLRLDHEGEAPTLVTLDGKPVNWRTEEEAIVVDMGDATQGTLRIERTLYPDRNTELEGLYASNGMLCTQCEAEGFRRIIPFVDRPDNLSVFTVTLSGDRKQFPILLCNGEKGDEKDLGDGRHCVTWHDPWLKPSYLFALVAGDLVATTDSFTTMSGKPVELNIYVRDGDQARTGHAMVSLKQAMDWDERIYGREYDLSVFNIVAVSDFNMGAMENKGLNVFNTRYILADQDTATDMDYDGVAGVVAHEYFHNWSGNRVTCRDWFQLSLKEGFTVFRDQQFSADTGSPPVKRIEDVRILRGAQFPEDSGPLAHPIRPDSYMEIGNFYTATVYNKGAEVIRMMHTIAGGQRFRQGTDLYFDRHDGQAATCEDFVRAIEDGAGLDLSQFRLWYSQAGTPQVAAQMTHDAAGKTVKLTLRQTVPPTPGQNAKKPMVLPIKTALFDRATNRNMVEELLMLDSTEKSWTFEGFDSPPVLSINRAFSAPVTVTTERGSDDLAFLATHDDDAFARYEALQQLMIDHLIGRIARGDADEAGVVAIVSAVGAILDDGSLDDLMRAEMLVLPSEGFLAEQMLIADPGAIHKVREELKHRIGAVLADQWAAHHDRCSAIPFSLSAEARGARKMANLALVYILAGDLPGAAERAYEQFANADNMTQRQGALGLLVSTTSSLREKALAEFYDRYRGNALVIDKWFGLQAGSLHADVLKHIRELADHPDFSMTNPNRFRALFGMLSVNSKAFHDASGEGYRMLADRIIELDAINPQTAAKMVPALGRWRKYEEKRSALMRGELERIKAQPRLSKDVAEQVSKSLG